MDVNLTTGVLFLSVMTVVNASAVNLLRNAGFENGALAPWFQSVDNFGGGENWNVTNAGAYSGSYCATDRGNKLLEQNFSPVPVADIMSISFALRNMDASVNAIYFRYSNGSTEENLIHHQDSNWHVYDFTSYLNAGRSLVAFGVYGVQPGTTGRTYLDDVSLNVVPEPGSFALIGMGCATFLLRGQFRKR
jgi:hypothetical protein